MKLLGLWLLITFATAVTFGGPKKPPVEPVSPLKSAVAKRPFLAIGKCAAVVSAREDKASANAHTARDLRHSNKHMVIVQ